MSDDSNAPTFHLVDQHVARNPIARAVQRQRIQQAVRDFRVRLWPLEDGELVNSDVSATAKVLVVAIRVLDDAGQHDSVAERVMRGGMSTLVQISRRRFIWHRQDAQALDAALEHATATLASATAHQVQAAWLATERGDAHAVGKSNGSAQR